MALVREPLTYSEFRSYSFYEVIMCLLTAVQILGKNKGNHKKLFEITYLMVFLLVSILTNYKKKYMLPMAYSISKPRLPQIHKFIKHRAVK